jgi:hypothetical protein
MYRDKNLTLFASLIICLTCIVSAEIATAQDLADISGPWDSSIGFKYEVTQNGSSYTWLVKSNGQKAEGSLTGNTVSATWSEGGRHHSAVGRIIVDENGFATRIEWNNGVVFMRPRDYQPPKVKMMTGTATVIQKPDITGTWSSSINVTYYIKQQGDRFTWSAPQLNQDAWGEISGRHLQASWKNQDGRTDRVHGTMYFDDDGKLTSIRWRNNVIFNRIDTTVDATQLKQPEGQLQTVNPDAVSAKVSELAPLHTALARLIEQRNISASAAEFISAVRNPQRLMQISQQTGSEEEQLYTLAYELELVQAIGKDNITSDELVMLKDMDLETVASIGSMEGREDLLISAIGAWAREKGQPFPPESKIRAWVQACASHENALPRSVSQLKRAAQPLQMIQGQVAVLEENSLKTDYRNLLKKVVPQQVIVLEATAKPGSLGQFIALESNKSNAFNLRAGQKSIVFEFPASKPGLYYANIDIALDQGHGIAEIVPSIEKPEIQLHLQNKAKTVTNAAQMTILDKPAAAASKLTGYRRILATDESLGQNSNNHFCFYLPQANVPLNGKLRLKLDLIRFTGKAQPTGGKEDFTKAKPQAVAPDIPGSIRIRYVPPIKIDSFDTTFDIPGSKILDTPFVFVETPLFQRPLKNNLPTDPVFLTFLISHAERISSAIDNQAFYDELSTYYPGSPVQELGIMRKGVPVKGRTESIKYFFNGKYPTDLADQQYSTINEGVEMLDIRNPETGVYRVLVSTDAALAVPRNISKLATTGHILRNWKPVNNLHEMRVVSRNWQVPKHYVAELFALEVSGQSEGDSGDDMDDGYGEFIIKTTAALSKRQPFAGLESLSATQALTFMDVFSQPYPLRPAHQSTQHVFIRPSKGFKSSHIIFPHLPMFDIGEQMLSDYKDMVLSVSVVEDDKRSWWQDHEEVFKKVFNFVKTFIAGIKNPKSLLSGFASGILPLFTHKMDFEDVDDQIGHPAMVTSIEGNWGLLNDNEYLFTTIATPDLNKAVYATEPASSPIRANVMSTVNEKGNWAKAYIRLKQYPRIFSWADVRLASFRLRESTDGDGKPTNVKVRFGLPEYERRPVWPPKWAQVGEWKNLVYNATPSLPITIEQPGEPAYRVDSTTGALLPANDNLVGTGMVNTSPQEEYYKGYNYIKGFTYFQAEFWDEDPGSDTFLGIASYTLYHADVWKYAGMGPQTFYDGHIVMNSYKKEGSPFYVAEVTVKDPGSWIAEVSFIAYVYIYE